jgi:hypothetical protein
MESYTKYDCKWIFEILISIKMSKKGRKVSSHFSSFRIHLLNSLRSFVPWWIQQSLKLLFFTSFTFFSSFTSFFDLFIRHRNVFNKFMDEVRRDDFTRESLFQSKKLKVMRMKKFILWVRKSIILLFTSHWLDV